MKFHYGMPIFAGLIIFLGLVTFPLWFNAPSEAYKDPEPKLPTEAEVKAAGFDKYACVEDTQYMRENHMQLLDHWRDWALRNGEREYVSHDGRTFEISLQKTCMKCHTSKKDFCDKCHTAAAVSPYCWDCHIQPEGYNETH